MTRTTALPSSLLFLLLVGSAGQAQAGEHLTQEALLRRARGVAQVRVRLIGRDKAKVSVEKWLMGPEGPLKVLLDPRSSCLPSRRMLWRWIASSYARKLKHTKRLWRQAIRAGGYRAIIFFRETGQLKGRAGVLRPYCEVERETVANWLSHPAFPAWHARLLGLIKARQAHASGQAAPNRRPTVPER